MEYIAYYKFIFDVVVCNDKQKLKEQIVMVNQWKKALRTDNTTNKYENYISWNFLDIKKVINQMDEKENCEKKHYLLQATAYMISFRDEFEMQSWGRSADM